MTEPWLRGPIPGLHPAAAHIVYTFAQCREEIALHSLGVPDVWKKLEPIAPLGFHLAHIAGSVNRLTTYLRGEQLTADQLARLKTESTSGATLTELLAAMDAEFVATETLVRSIDPQTYEEPRYVGRQQLPTTVGGLIVHIAEHTQRHLGQAILTAKLSRQDAFTPSTPATAARRAGGKPGKRHCSLLQRGQQPLLLDARRPAA